MSEKYGKCSPCMGSECFVCGGMGFNGDAIAYIEKERKEEFGKQFKGYPSAGIVSFLHFQKEEAKFYRNQKRHPGLIAAIEKIESLEREKKMSKEVVLKENQKTLDLGKVESVFIKGDISAMNEMQRVDYVREVCKSLGLNPLTNPFDYIAFQGKIQLYAKKGCTDQLRNIYNISVTIVSQVMEEGILTVTARAHFPDGRSDEDIGSVSVAGLRGDALCNAKMKAVTKAKRRVTLSICGLGMMDETETESIPNSIRGEKVFNSYAFSKPSEAQLKELAIISKRSGYSIEDVKTMIQKDYGLKSSHDLTMDQFKHLLSRLSLVKTEPKILPLKEIEETEEMKEEEMGAWEEQTEDPRLVK